MAFRSTRNQGSFRRSGKRRLTEWSICSAPTGFSTIAATSKVILVLVPESNLADVGPATVVRIRGQFSVAPTVDGVDVNMIGAFGMGFVNVVAGALGVTGVPGPHAQCDWGGWMVHQFFNIRWTATTDIGRAFSSREFEIDSKAMRKFESGMSMAWIIENAGGASFDAAVSARVLVKAG